MSALSPRLERALLAAGLGLVLSIALSVGLEQRSFAAINRGDFPAFYTLALLAGGNEGQRLYDLELQRQVQNAVWPSLSGTVLPAAYPAYLAFLLQPLAHLGADASRVVWVCLMVLCVVGAIASLVRSVPTLNGLGWQLGVGVFLFAPLFIGVVGGQLVGLSFLCYAVLFALSKRRTFVTEIVGGIVAGLWMVKPHFALAVAAIFLFERRWVALSAWFGMSLVFWMLGARVAGPQWVSEWMSFARQFSEIDLATNAHQMTGVVGALYSFVSALGGGALVSTRFWDVLSIALSLLVPLGLVLASRVAKRSSQLASAPLLCLGPLLVLFAPVVNFYDLSLALIPLIVLMRPSKLRDVTIAACVLIASQFVALGKGFACPGITFMVALGMAILCWRALAREGAAARGS